jgi:hypothetical protein
MVLPDDSEFRAERRHPPINEAPKPTAQRQSTGVSLVAYVFLLANDAEATLQALRELAARGPAQGPITFPVAEKSDNSAVDSWLPHGDAAEYLGISESTLYRYAEQEKIECRKLCGRLQYRLSSLEKFKDQHIRPARRPLRNRAIIPAAPSSGK